MVQAFRSCFLDANRCRHNSACTDVGALALVTRDQLHTSNLGYKRDRADLFPDNIDMRTKPLLWE